MKLKLLIFFCIINLKVGIGQALVPVHTEGWILEHNQGSCYHDTIIHAIWLYIDPFQELQRYDNDSSFVIVEVEVVNKSPIDVYIHGYQHRLKAYVTEEYYVPDSSRTTLDHFRRGAIPPRKLEEKLAFNREDYRKNPHKDLANKFKDELVLIEQGKRKKLLVSVPKRFGTYRVNGTIEFNKERYAYDCCGNRVSWSRCRVIASNRFQLTKRME